MATYDYSARKPADGAFDYPVKINALIDDLSTDITLESGRSDGFQDKLIHITVSAPVNLTTEQSKLSGIDPGAKDDQTGPEIKALYEGELNAYTDTINTRLLNTSGTNTGDQDKANIDALGINAAYATDAGTLDTLDSTEFVRKSVDSTIDADLTLLNNRIINLGTSGDVQFYHNGSNGLIFNNTGSFNITSAGGITLTGPVTLNGNPGVGVVAIDSPSQTIITVQSVFSGGWTTINVGTGAKFAMINGFISGNLVSAGSGYVKLYARKPGLTGNAADKWMFAYSADIITTAASTVGSGGCRFVECDASGNIQVYAFGSNVTSTYAIVLPIGYYT